MTNYQERRERIAAQVLAGMMADPSVDGHPSEFAVSAIEFADALIAELDRTAPQQMESNHPGSPEGWVVWDDFSDRRYPIRDSLGQWLHRVHPWDNRAEAEAVADDLGCRVRRWPLDPAEDKPEEKS